ncbi:MAG: PhoH family protein [Planctomycetota bacterium]|nr:PhoH family protein [Planctomycetota bacterium]
MDRLPIFGVAERNLKMIREALGVAVTARDSTVKLKGEGPAVDAARQVFLSLIRASERGITLDRQQVLDAIAEAGWQAGRRSGGGAESGARFGVEGSGEGGGGAAGPGGPGAPGGAGGGAGGPARLDVYVSGRPIVARSENQQAYIDAIRDHDLVFGVGPAGTGKTYLAVAAGIHLLKTGRVKKLVLARPAVEAGEKLGFLPGDQFAKVNPYLRPLLDALHDMMDYATIKRFMANDVVEISPLAYMRGRTLNDAAIILDEAQNTTRGQMHMFLTRMGQRSKMVITGDTTQVDLPDPRESGLIDAARRLRRVNGVAFCALDTRDVVRHPLVQRIIEAYADDAAALGRGGVGGGGGDGAGSSGGGDA